MHEFKLDSEGNLTLTCEVIIGCHGKRFLHLGTGPSSIAKFCDIVEEGIPESIKIDCLWDNNYLVTMTGKDLAAFLRKHYPEKESYIRKIDPTEEYVIDCYDMS
jgi:hypothetical protein